MITRMVAFRRIWIPDASKLTLATVLVVAATVGCSLCAMASPAQKVGAPLSIVTENASVKVYFTTALPEGVTQSMVEEGRVIFHDRGGCFRCHGKDGAGTFFGPSLTNRLHIHLQTGGYQEIMDLIRSGVPRPKRYLGAMPPLGGAQLNNNEVRAVGAFVYTLVHGS